MDQSRNSDSLVYGGDEAAAATQFFGRRAVRDTWIAVWAMWILWALLFVAKQAFSAARITEAHRTERVAVAEPVAIPERGPFDVSSDVTPIPGDNLGAGSAMPTAAEQLGQPHSVISTHPDDRSTKRDRILRIHDLIRDLTLMLLLVVTVNTFGHGSGVLVLILTWIYLATAFIWAGLMMLIESRILDMVMGTIKMMLLLAMLIAAYTIGWVVLL
ncbi:hypothetical protein BG011_004785 [Mortierella polycephala]|uniref:Uncharacterized protein n=1 Tax=Mortierella polycephala TaxID=41804 RepID=A0A9P6QH37_9FUNG|nr:hypothetical protein BG011_004785 [Mortierella polycephala]